MQRISVFLSVLFLATLAGCDGQKSKEHEVVIEQKENKKVVYQVFTRLFGNTNTTNKPWGTIEENGVGKFNDFTDKALTASVNITGIWE